MNFYPHHIGDYLSATAHLTWTEDCAYRRLLDAYYTREAPLPADIAACCRLVRAAAKDERKAVETVLREFFHLDGDGWRHRRCDAEIERATSKRSKAAESANKRWQSKGNANAHANASPNAMRTHTECNAPNPNPNPNPISDDLTIIVEGDDALPPTTWSDWARWWRAHRGIEVDPGDVRDRKRFVPLAERWIAARITPGQMRRAVERAEAVATEPIAYLPSYVDRVLASEQAPPNGNDAHTAAMLGGLTGGLAGTPIADHGAPDDRDRIQPRRLA